MTHRSKSNEPLSVLVLVKERITTAAVARLITEISESTPLYAGLKASHCVSASLTNNVASMSTGEQLDALEGFRANRFNVLVATTVVEEGLDVRACNVVIKADELTNFRSFIQSQGRARAKVSYFVLMTEDEHKCRLTVDRFLQMEKRIGDSIEGRCIDSSDEEEEEENYDDVTEIAKTSYMPYGINGPRITASGAASVLMRYIGLLKTDTSYTLKILYSVRKEFGGYQVKMLMPPPSPLQEIITGPCASSKDLAKQLVRVEACKRLHEAGLLNRDLLPIDFRKLVSIAKNTNLSSQIDREEKREEMNELVNAMSRLIVEPTDHEHLNVVSQANLLLTPLEGDMFTSLGDPFNIQCPSNVSLDPGSPEMTSSDDDELPPGIMLCTSPSKMQPTPSQSRTIEKESRPANVQETSPPRKNSNGLEDIYDDELPPGIVLCSSPSKMQPKPSQPRTIEKESRPANAQETSPPRKNSNGLEDIYDNHIIDDELPLENSVGKKGSSQPANKSRFYEIHRLFSLSSPYQEPIRAGRTCYLYTWRLPSPKDVATCTNVNAECFRHTNQTIGLLFSKRISKNYCNQHNETLSYKVLGDMLEAIIGAVFIDCGGVTSIVTGVIYNLLQKEIEAYGKKIPVDPVRLMYEEYPGMEITLEKFDKNGPRVRVMAKFKDHIITGEGKNTRTAKLDLAQQLGINIC
ncbi:hypothetical protein Aperf_G00000110235 [Anoplocephala perfoliata]